MRNIGVDSVRLWTATMQMAAIGATENGGCHRLALSEEDRRARDLFSAWMRDAGCTITVDAIGNIFARREGADPSLAPVMVGSHLDTVPMGGKFDGPAGVIAGVELVRALNDHGVHTRAPVEIVAWTNEEGSRFSPFTMGSSVFAGQLALKDAHAARDITDPLHGPTAGEALRAIGYQGDAPTGGRRPACYLEMHIEQGPQMADEDLQVGIVTGSFQSRYFVATITGEQAHVGPTPMAGRRDALVITSRLVLEIDRIGRAYGPTAAPMRPISSSRPMCAASFRAW